jgi:hypothetical protein
MVTKGSKKPTSKKTAKPNEAMKTVTLPSSKVKIQFSADFNQQKLADLTRELCVNEKLAAQMRANPSKSLAKLGIFIDDDDRRLVNDEDILAAMGHRATASAIAGLPLVAALVVVAVINFPEPAY